MSDNYRNPPAVPVFPEPVREPTQLDRLRARAERLSSIARAVQRVQPDADAWLIETPNPKYSGLSHALVQGVARGLRIEDGAAVLAGPLAEQTARMFESDLGYAATHLSVATVRKLLGFPAPLHVEEKDPVRASPNLTPTVIMPTVLGGRK